MPSCVFRHCKNYYSKVNKTQGISYHIFPFNSVAHEKWVSIVRKQRYEPNWTPSKSSAICSDHFRKKDKYFSNKGYLLLRKNVVPIIKKRKKLKINLLNSSSSLYNVSKTDMKAILTKNIELKKRVRQLNLEKIQLQKRNKTLLQINRRMKAKIMSIVVRLRGIRKKDYIYFIL